MIEKNFLFSYPQNFTLCSPFGRGTRGMTGCDVDLEGYRNHMVYIKDYWRPEGGENSTVGMMCVMQYAGTVTLRK